LVLLLLAHHSPATLSIQKATRLQGLAACDCDAAVYVAVFVAAVVHEIAAAVAAASGAVGDGAVAGED